MLQPESVPALFALPALAGLPPRLRDALEAQAQPLRFAAGKTLFDVGCACATFLILDSGSLRVTKPAPSGREILLYRVRPGESCILSVACLLSESVYSARGTAETELVGFTLPRVFFCQLLDEWPPFRQFIFAFFSERIVELMGLIEEVAFRALNERVASALLAHCEPVMITHQRLADEVGSVREVVSRILKEFEAQGLVRLERGCIRILDRERLTSMAWPHEAT
jgi:CRP/FNR family transcriptional regulator